MSRISAKVKLALVPLAGLLLAVGEAAAQNRSFPSSNQPRFFPSTPSTPSSNQFQNQNRFPSNVTPGTNQNRSYPSYPVIVTPSQLNGFNPNGTPNTSNNVINNSAFDPFREMSKNIPGNVQNVHQIRPDGRLEVGQKWYNPVTGQWHAETQVISGNNLGGMHIENNFRSANPNASRPGTSTPTTISPPRIVTPQSSSIRTTTPSYPAPPIINPVRPR